MPITTTYFGCMSVRLKRGLLQELPTSNRVLMTLKINYRGNLFLGGIVYPGGFRLERVQFPHRKRIGLVTEGIHLLTGIDYELSCAGKVLAGVSKTLCNAGA
jgi:hypothetical protein